MKRIVVLVAIAVLCSGSAVASGGIEFGSPCVFSVRNDYGVVLYDYTYTADRPYPASWSAPSKVAINVGDDGWSRYVTGKLRFSGNGAQTGYFGYGFNQFRLNQGRTFEIETHFYNYDDAAAKGWGPGYVLDAQGAFTCTIPNCYRDTQAGSATNAHGEYSQVNIQFGSYDLSGYYGVLLRQEVTYDFGTRATTGRGNKNLMKVNFQMMQNRTLGASNLFGMLRCSNTTDYAMLDFGLRVFAPTCVQNYGGNYWQSCY